MFEIPDWTIGQTNISNYRVPSLKKLGCIAVEYLYYLSLILYYINIWPIRGKFKKIYNDRLMQEKTDLIISSYKR